MKFSENLHTLLVFAIQCQNSHEFDLNYVHFRPSVHGSIASMAGYYWAQYLGGGLSSPPPPAHCSYSDSVNTILEKHDALFLVRNEVFYFQILHPWIQCILHIKKRLSFNAKYNHHIIFSHLFIEVYISSFTCVLVKNNLIVLIWGNIFLYFRKCVYCVVVDSHGNILPNFVSVWKFIQAVSFLWTINSPNLEIKMLLTYFFPSEF